MDTHHRSALAVLDPLVRLDAVQVEARRRIEVERALEHEQGVVGPVGPGDEAIELAVEGQLPLELARRGVEASDADLRSVAPHRARGRPAARPRPAPGGVTPIPCRSTYRAQHSAHDVRGRLSRPGATRDGVAESRCCRAARPATRGYRGDVTTVSKDAQSTDPPTEPADRSPDLAALADALTPGALLTDPAGVAAYRFDFTADESAGMPLAVVRATSAADVQATVRWAGAHGIPLVPRGCGQRAVRRLQRDRRVRRAQPRADARSRDRCGHAHGRRRAGGAQRRGEAGRRRARDSGIRPTRRPSRSARSAATSRPTPAGCAA